MTVEDLRFILEGLPGDMPVVCPLNAGQGFDGIFFSPCLMESGEADLGLIDAEDDIEEFDEIEAILDPPSEKSFILVPCGFFEIHEEQERIQNN